MIATAMLLGAGAVLLTSGGTGVARQRLHSVSGVRLDSGGFARSPAADQQRWSSTGAVVLAVAAAVAALGPGLAALSCSAAWAGRSMVRRRRVAAEQAAAARAVPAAFRVLAAELNAGSLPADALDAAAAGRPRPLATLLAAAASAERLGASAVSVLAQPPECCAATRALGVCWAVSAGSGATLAHSVGQLAAAFSAELEAQAVVAAELAGVRLSALVMAGLPILGLGLGATLGSDPLGFLLGSAAGRLALALAVALDALGLWWVSVLARRAAR